MESDDRIRNTIGGRSKGLSPIEFRVYRKWENFELYTDNAAGNVVWIRTPYSSGNDK